MNVTDQKIKDLLIKSGWYENRRIDTSNLLEKVSENGYEILPKVIEFLKEFDGLIIRFYNLKNSLADDDVTIDFNKASELECIERIREDYQHRIGKRLCVIGTAYREYFVLIMDEEGRVYGGYDDYLVKIADSAIEAINAIVSGKKFTEIVYLGD